MDILININKAAFVGEDPEETTLVRLNLHQAIEQSQGEQAANILSHRLWTLERCISFSRQMAGSFRNSLPRSEALAKECELETGMYEYIQDHHPEIITFGDVMDALKERTIEPEMVEKWVEQALFSFGHLRSSLLCGYPEHAPVIKSQIRALLETHERPMDCIRKAAQILLEGDR